LFVTGASAGLLEFSPFMVTLFLPSTCVNRLLLVWLLSLEARTALRFQREKFKDSAVELPPGNRARFSQSG
jgi:hypothetical protein